MTPRQPLPHLIALCLLLFIGTHGLAAPAAIDSRQQEAREDAIAAENWAYSLGVQAYVFGLPLSIFEREYRLRSDVDKIERIKHKCPCAVINQVGHKFSLATAADVMPYTPNNDTVYSGILLQASDEPVILSLPDISDRYWSVQVANPYLENQFYIGTRATGGKGGHHAFFPKNWQGELPAGVTPHPVDYDTIIFAVRIAVTPDNPADLEQVHALQKQINVTSLSNFKQGKMGVAAMPDNIPPAKTYGGELAWYQQLADLLNTYPPAPEHAAMVNSFKLIGIEPGQPMAVDKLSAATRKGLLRALADGRDIMKWKVKYRGTPYPTRWNNLRPGDYGFDYLDRAAGALEGLFVHDREEAVYFSTYESGDGKFLDGAKRYVLHFDKDEIPPLVNNGFWSLTMYGRDFQLVPNPIARYAIGSRSENLQYNPDGSLDIYIQSTPPAGKQGNWLPSPEAGIFRINYRIYLPPAIARNPDTLARFLPPIEVR